MDNQFSAVEIREKICSVEDLCEDIFDRAEKANRDLTDAEKKQVERLMGKGKRGAKNYKPGELDKLHDQLDQAEKREQLAADRQRKKIDQLLEDGTLSFNNELVGRDFAGYHTGTPVAKRMQESKDGKRFAVLNKGDKLTDYHRPPCEDGFGHYVAAKLFGIDSNTPEPIRNAMSTSEGTGGGFMVPEELSSEVIDLARSRSVLMDAGVRTLAMSSGSMLIPSVETDVDPESKAENATFKFDEFVLGARQLTTKTVGCYTKVSRELADDARGMFASQLSEWLTRSLAVQIDKFGLQGDDDQADFTGLVHHTQYNETTGVGAIDWLDVSSAATRVRVSNHEPTVAIMHPTIYSDLSEIESGDGTNSARNWLNRPPNLENVTFLQTTNCPLANMLVGDFSRGYAMGVRQNITVEATTEAGSAFADHQVWIKAFARIAFVPMDVNAIERLAGITS